MPYLQRPLRRHLPSFQAVVFPFFFSFYAMNFQADFCSCSLPRGMMIFGCRMKRPVHESL